MILGFLPILENYPESMAAIIGATVLVVMTLLLLLGWQVFRIEARFIRRWDSVDRRLSEVLWRTRNGDPESIRRRTAMLEENLEETLRTLRTVASAMDTQLEMLRNEIKASLAKVDRVDSKNLGQNRVVVYQLEKIRNQLKSLEGIDGTRLKAGGAGGRGTVGGVGSGYRMEAVLEPLNSKAPQKSEEPQEDMEQLIKKLHWEQSE